jgi:hypothetical protein
MCIIITHSEFLGVLNMRIQITVDDNFGNQIKNRAEELGLSIH